MIVLGGRVIGVLPVGIHGVRVRVHGIVVIVVVIVRTVISTKVERIVPLVVVVLVI